MSSVSKSKPQSKTLDDGDRPLLDLLHRHGSLGIREFCEHLGVTPTAVRQRLTRLETRSFVDREVIREGRGRPSHRYRISEEGRRQLGENYAELALILWREVFEGSDPIVRERLLSRLKDTLVQRYGAGVRAETIRERIDELSQSLNDFGLPVEVDTSGELPILRETHCPYHDLASQDATICELEQAVFSEILGVNLQLGSCCRDGDACCEFEPVPENSQQD